MKQKMQHEQVTFVKLSTLFSDCPDALGQFNYGDFDISFGDASHTLINQDMFLRMLSDAGLTEEELKDNDHPMKEKVTKQLEVIYQRVDTLGDSILIDLEN